MHVLALAYMCSHYCKMLTLEKANKANRSLRLAPQCPASSLVMMECEI